MWADMLIRAGLSVHCIFMKNVTELIAQKIKFILQLSEGLMGVGVIQLSYT